MVKIVKFGKGLKNIVKERTKMDEFSVVNHCFFFHLSRYTRGELLSML